MTTIPMERVEMIVTQISATCKATEATIQRTMTLKDRKNFGSWSHDVTVTMPAIDGVGTGDVLTMDIEFKHDAAVEQLQRATEILEKEAADAGR